MLANLRDALRGQSKSLNMVSGVASQWARGHVPPLAFENFFSLYVETSCLVWFGTMPNSQRSSLFSSIRFGMIP